MLNKKDAVQTSPSIKIEDSEAPQLILNENQKTIVVIGNEYKEEGATATDNIDGDISSEIKISGDLDTLFENKWRISEIDSTVILSREK